MRRVINATALTALLFLVAACDKNNSDPVITDPDGNDGTLTQLGFAAVNDR